MSWSLLPVVSSPRVFKTDCNYASEVSWSFKTLSMTSEKLSYSSFPLSPNFHVLSLPLSMASIHF
jgi:hypothetical protein